jgi:hypothetical protein
MSGSENKPATKGDLKAMLDAMRKFFRPASIASAGHAAELADIRDHIKDKMVTRDEFHSRMDGVADDITPLGPPRL